jgi:hypothetical protein
MLFTESKAAPEPCNQTENDQLFTVFGYRAEKRTDREYRETQVVQPHPTQQIRHPSQYYHASIVIIREYPVMIQMPCTMLACKLCRIVGNPITTMLESSAAIKLPTVVTDNTVHL